MIIVEFIASAVVESNARVVRAVVYIKTHIYKKIYQIQNVWNNPFQIKSLQERAAFVSKPHLLAKSCLQKQNAILCMPQKKVIAIIH